MNSSKDDGRRRIVSGRSLLFGNAVLLLLVTAGPIQADSWQERAPVPGPRAANSAVWTGREMIVWGGGVDGSFLNTGARYVPSTDTWRETSPYGAPSPRWFHAAVWTGSEMIIWGGRASFSPDNHAIEGARYNPATDTWTPMNTEGAPTPRSQFAAVWTGAELIVWGGETEGGVELNDGARYDPETDTWSPISSDSGLEPRMEPTGIWTGEEMIVFGGMKYTGGQLSFGNGARYNPVSNAWRPLPSDGAPRSRTGHTAIWTGERMIVWGGREMPAYELFNDGSIYNPGSDAWTPIPFSYDAPQARMYHAAAWTGSEMIIWGGHTDASGILLNTGARFNPATGAWVPTTQVNAPGKRMFWRPDLGVWTGNGMLVCAGSDYPTSLDSTYLYSLVDPPCPPAIREQPQSVTVTIGSPVTLSVGAEDCEAGSHPTAEQEATGAQAERFEFDTGARQGRLKIEYQFFSVSDSLRVYYEGQRIFDEALSGEETIWVPFGPGQSTRVEIVVNEDSGAPNTAWHYTVSFSPPPLGYQWRKNGAALEGETGATLQFPSVSLEDAGDYSVVVANNRGTVVSAVATLTVLPSSSTNCVAVPSGLVALWRGDGDASDVTGAHDGMLLEGTTFFSPGRVGQAFTFDLSRARVSIPDDDAFKLTDSLSFEGWINVASHAPGLIFIRGDNRGGLDPYHMSIQPSGQLHWGINTAENNFTALYSPGAVGTGVWMHVAAVLDGATGDMGLYVNGVLVSQTNTTLRPLRDLDPNSEPTLGIGNHGGTFHHFPFHGSVDEWALYSRALSAAEVRAIFLAGGGKCDIPPSPAGSHDLARDYSTSMNPNGVWSFGWKSTLGGAFNLFGYHAFELDNGALIDYWLKDSSGPSSVYHNSGPDTLVNNDGQGVYPPGTVWFGPGYQGNPDNFSVIRFTVPNGAGGTYRVHTVVRSALDGPISGDTDFHVLKNGGEVFGQNLPPNGGTSYSNLLTLAAGDTIDFACGRGPDGNEYASGLKIQATLTLVTNVPPACAPPGLVAWWRGDGDATDVTSAHDGTLLFGTTFSPGVAGQAFTFDLSRARVSIPDDDAFKLTDSLSFEGWINVASYAPGIIFIRGDNRGGLDPYHMSIQPSGQVYWGINTLEDDFTGLYSPGAVSTGVWMHVAAVLDGATGNMGMYINGSLVNQTNTNLRPLRDLDPNWEPAIGIGNAGGTFHHFPYHGSVDEWALYSRALSAAEVQGIFNAGAGKCSGTNPPQPVVVYDVSKDFSPTTNPTGPWSYGYSATLGGPFHLLTFAKSYPANNGVPISGWQVSDVFGPSVNRVMGNGVAMSEGGAFTAPSGTVYVWPGNDGSPGVFGVIRFTVPAGGSGLYRIDSAVRPTFDGPVSGDTDFHVLRNGQELFGQFLAPNTGTGYSNSVALGAGDSIDFVVGEGADGSPDHSSLKVHAVVTFLGSAPPPARVFDLSGDFSLAANPNGAWSYGHRTNRLTGGIQLLNTSRTFGAENGVPIDIWQLNNAKPWVAKVIGPATAVSFHFNAPAGTIYFGPDPDATPEDFAVIRFTVPPGAGGGYRLETSVRSLYDNTRSADADFHVTKNGQELFGAVVPPNSATGYSNIVTLAVGDRIDFVAGRGPNALPDTGLKIQATLTSVTGMAMSIGSTLPLADGSGVRVTGQAPPGTVCRVQRSVNLIDWEDAGSVAATTNGVFEFIDSQPADGPACFYRLRGSDR